MGKYDDYKKNVLTYSQMLLSRGYTVGTGGNVSVLIEGEEAIAITPSGKEYIDLTPEDICVVDFNCSLIEGSFRPSIETGMHISVYKNRLDVNAVIHTHQTFASVFAILGHPVPALFDEAVINIGDVIDIIPYALSGSPELADNVAGKLDNRCNCYIIQNHGALCLGTNINKAFRNVELLEKCSQVYYYALSTGKEITTLPQPMVSPLFQILQSGQDIEIARKKDSGKSQ
ncbi:MAG: class II aldolase/adducin family protein [Bacillota bacterium]